MTVTLKQETMDSLRAAHLASLSEAKGLIGPRDHAHLAAGLKTFGESIDSRNPATGQVDEARKAMHCRYLHHQLASMRNAVAAQTFEGRYMRHAVPFFETTQSGDIATYTQQVLAFVAPVFEKMFVDQLVHFRAMQGPTAFVHTLDFQVGTAGGAYALGSSLNEGLDVNYADCPAECDAANEIDLVLTSVTVNAECKRLQAKWCLPAQQDYRSQHGRSVGDDVRMAIQTQLMRERQGEIINQLVAGAGFSGTWSSTIPVGSVYNTLDPKAYEATLYDAISDADNEIFKSTDGYRKADWILADPDTINRLEKLKHFTITSNDRVPREGAGEAVIDEFGGFVGVANRQYNVWKAPFMTASTVLLGVKSDAPQELGFVHAEYVPLFDLGTWLDPSTGQYRTGMQTRYANQMIRSGLYARVTIT